MGQLKINEHWAKELFPDGIHFPSSTIITGKGGSGKPLVELSFVAEWLRSGKKAIGIPLQYPTADFMKNSLWKLNGIDVDKYSGQIMFVQFNPDLEEIEEKSNEVLSVNLLKSEKWDEMLDKTYKKLNIEVDEDVLIFGSALNLLLFAPKYKQENIQNIKSLLENTQNFTYLFTVSNNVMGEDIAIWEKAANNLLFTEMTEDKKLFIYAERINDREIKSEKYAINIEPGTLDEIKNIAEKNRKSLIPKLKKIKDE